MSGTSKNKDSQKEILKLPYWVLSVSLLLTFGATYIFHQSARANDLSRFQGEAEAVKNRIEILVSSYIAIVKATRGFIESDSDLSQKKFADFAKRLEPDESHSGIKGIGCTTRNQSVARLGAEKTVPAVDVSDFQISPESSKHSEQQANVFFQTFDKSYHNSFDLFAEPMREAQRRAFDTGEASATGKVNLILGSESAEQNGFLIFAPVYKEINTLPTIDEKRMLPDGYVFSPIQAADFIRDVRSGISVNDLAITIYDSELNQGNILAQTDPGFTPFKEELRDVREINVVGRKWIIEYQSLPSFMEQSSTGWTPLVFICGLIFSLLLFGMTYLETFARARAENIARDLRESEREKAFLLEREQNERKRAEEASKAKDEFISVVSHELRTPLNSIAGWSRILKDENLSPATKQRALQKIDKSLRAQTEIVEELLDFSQLISNKSDLSKDVADFSKIFEQAFNQAEKAASEKGITLIKENTINGRQIPGDSERLQTVIKNLLSNAIKFTPKGGTIMAEVREAAAGNRIELKIKDTGQGIRTEFLPHVFESFKQDDSSITRQHGGLGLGLAIARRIVKLHGGTIEAASEGDGKGAVFTVRLPTKL